jgi:CheY-like chemotaxis protein
MIGPEEVTGQQPMRGTETILLVEDEPMVLDLSKSILKDCGYRVLAAENGVDALRISDNICEPIHLLIADVVMP